MKKIRR